MTTIERRALTRLAVVLLAALGIVLMHGVSADHDVMRISLPASHVMMHEASAPHSQGAPVSAYGDAMTAMDHAACVAVLRSPDIAPHAPLAPSATVVSAAEISALTTPAGDTGLPSRAKPPDLATELCISRT